MYISLSGLNNGKIGYGKNDKKWLNGSRAKLARIDYIRIISTCAEKNGAAGKNVCKKGENGCKGQNG